jgi:hypothetical protein
MHKNYFRLIPLGLVMAALPVLVLGQAQSKPVPAAPAAQPAQPTTAQAPLPEARPGDVDTVEHLLAAVYDVISGPAGQPRDWNRFRSLFYPGIGRLMPSGRNPAGVIGARSFTPDEYVERASSAFAKDGFYEVSVANRIEIWDHLAQAWSTYESRHAKDDKPFARGINSFQFIHDGKRWWVITIYWEGEEAAHPLPEKYLK